MFSLDGMGLYFINALGTADPYPVMAWLMVTATMIIVFNLIADIALRRASTPECAMTDTRPAADMLPRSGRSVTVVGKCRSPCERGYVCGADSRHADQTRASSSRTSMGVELEARSQWAYARMRFFRHKLASRASSS